jgi:hypothetical protein
MDSTTSFVLHFQILIKFDIQYVPIISKKIDNYFKNFL